VTSGILQPADLITSFLYFSVCGKRCHAVSGSDAALMVFVAYLLLLSHQSLLFKVLNVLMSVERNIYFSCPFATSSISNFPVVICMFVDVRR